MEAQVMLRECPEIARAAVTTDDELDDGVCFAGHTLRQPLWVLVFFTLCRRCCSAVP